MDPKEPTVHPAEDWKNASVEVNSFKLNERFSFENSDTCLCRAVGVFRIFLETLKHIRCSLHFSRTKNLLRADLGTASGSATHETKNFPIVGLIEHAHW